MPTPTTTLPTLTPEAQKGLDVLKTSNPDLAASVLKSFNPAPTPSPAAASAISNINTDQPIDVGSLTGGSTLTLPSLPTPPVPSTANALPDLSTYFKSTPAEDQLNTEETGLENDITANTTKLGTKSAVQSDLETQAGLPTLQKQLAEINAQIEQTQSDELGQYNASEDRKAPTFVIQGEQAQEQRLASAKVFGLSAASQALQGNIALATDQVQKALSAEFDGIQSDIDNKKYLLQLNRDNFSDAEKKQADELTAELNKQQDDLTQARADKASILQIMTTAASNGADNVTLQRIQSSATPTDGAMAAGTFLQKANTQTVNVDGHVKLIDDKGNVIADLGTSDTALKMASDAATTAQVAQLTPYLKTSPSGIQYVDVSALSAGDKNKIAQIAGANGVQVITNASEGADITNIKNAYSNLDTMAATFAGLTSPNPTSRIFNNLGINSIATRLQTDAQKTASTALNDAALDLLKAISGVQGFRGNQAAIDQIRDNLPTIYDTSDVAAQKLATVRQLIQNREDAILTPASQSSAAFSTAAPDGNTYSFPTQAALDAFKKAAGIQ